MIFYVDVSFGFFQMVYARCENVWMIFCHNKLLGSITKPNVNMHGYNKRLPNS